MWDVDPALFAMQSTTGLSLATRHALKRNDLVLRVPREQFTTGSSPYELVQRVVSRASHDNRYLARMLAQPPATTYLDEWTAAHAEATGNREAVWSRIVGAQALATQCAQGREAYWQVTSRMFFDDDNAGYAFVPVADLCDHDVHLPVSYRLGPGAFELWAARDVPAMAPVEISYGTNLDNISLLSTYGFCVADNPHDTVALGGFSLSLASAPWEPLESCAPDEWVGMLADALSHLATLDVALPANEPTARHVKAYRETRCGILSFHLRQTMSISNQLVNNTFRHAYTPLVITNPAAGGDAPRACAAPPQAPRRRSPRPTNRASPCCPARRAPARAP